MIDLFQIDSGSTTFNSSLLLVSYTHMQFNEETIAIWSNLFPQPYIATRSCLENSISTSTVTAWGILAHEFAFQLSSRVSSSVALNAARVGRERRFAADVTMNLRVRDGSDLAHEEHGCDESCEGREEEFHLCACLRRVRYFRDIQVNFRRRLLCSSRPASM